MNRIPCARLRHRNRLRFFTVIPAALVLVIGLCAGAPLEIAQQAYLKASNTGASDQFGISVAASGDTVAVGAWWEDSAGPDSNDENALNSGAVYVFVRSGREWVQQARLKASNAQAGDQFGISVSVSGDTMVVGANAEDSAATDVNGNPSDDSSPSSGAAYVFVRQGTAWSQEAYLKASNTRSNSFFGRAVAISGDTVVVGALGEASNATGVDGNQADQSAPYAGAAYVFVRKGTTWTQQAYLKASNAGTEDQFGDSVAISGDTLVVGAFVEASGATGVNGDQTDNSAPIAGAAYIFARQGATWTQQAYLKAPNTSPNDRFGTSVAVSGDTVVIGAHGEDSAATGLNGDPNNDGAPDSGAAYIFVRDGSRWTQQAYLKASNANAGDVFGYSVSISGDVVAIGARGEDSNAVGVNGDRTDNRATNSGAAYVFVRRGSIWTQQAYLKSSNTDAQDQFGFGVAVSDDTVVISALLEDSAASGVNGDQSDNSAVWSGAAYVFVGVGLPHDADGDGVPDGDDACPDTPADAPVSAAGCSIEQLVPCSGPWRNHGEYLRALQAVIRRFIDESVWSDQHGHEVLVQAAMSDCGKR